MLPDWWPRLSVIPSACWSSAPRFWTSMAGRTIQGDLPKFHTVASIDDIVDNGARWALTSLGTRTRQIELKPRLVTSDLRTRLQAAIHGIGIALLPEQVV